MSDAMCDHCGKPEYKHVEIVGTGKVCPISCNTFSNSKSARIEFLLKQVEDMREALTKCRDSFREYEKLHLAKVQAPDRGDILDIRDKRNAGFEAKATRNREMADMCDAALKTGVTEG